MIGAVCLQTYDSVLLIKLRALDGKVNVGVLCAIKYELNDVHLNMLLLLHGTSAGLTIFLSFYIFL